MWWKTFLHGLGKYLGLVTDVIDEQRRANKLRTEQDRSRRIDADPAVEFDRMFGDKAADGDRDEADHN